MTDNALPTANGYSRAAAVVLAVWAFMHVGAAVSTWMTAGTVDGPLAAARIQQNAWHLFGMAIIVGILTPWIWRRRLGSAVVAVAITTFTDLGFIILLLLPGIVPIVPGIFGPSIWMMALILLALAHRENLKPPAPQDASKRL